MAIFYVLFKGFGVDKVIVIAVNLTWTRVSGGVRNWNRKILNWFEQLRDQWSFTRAWRGRYDEEIGTHETLTWSLNKRILTRAISPPSA